jgi:histidinol-phosphate aminotransferase
MRVGYGISRASTIEALYKLRPPFNITTLSLEAATVALEDEAFVEGCIKKCLDEMGRYSDFAAEHRIDIIESYTNFVTLVFDAERSASKLAQDLLERGMIVRDLKAYGLNAIRVTIGTPAQNDRFFELAASLL